MLKHVAPDILESQKRVQQGTTSNSSCPLPCDTQSERGENSHAADSWGKVGLASYTQICEKLTVLYVKGYEKATFALSTVIPNPTVVVFARTTRKRIRCKQNIQSLFSNEHALQSITYRSTSQRHHNFGAAAYCPRTKNGTGLIM